MFENLKFCKKNHLYKQIITTIVVKDKFIIAHIIEINFFISITPGSIIKIRFYFLFKNKKSVNINFNFKKIIIKLINNSVVNMQQY